MSLDNQSYWAELMEKARRAPSSEVERNLNWVDLHLEEVDFVFVKLGMSQPLAVKFRAKAIELGLKDAELLQLCVEAYLAD